MLGVRRKSATFSRVTTLTGTFTVFSTVSPFAALTAFWTAILPSSLGCWATDAYSVPAPTAFRPSGVPSKPTTDTDVPALAAERLDRAERHLVVLGEDTGDARVGITGRGWS
ncbi:hypothetical protein SMICM304S_00188 [Streptomyces microflavus]